MTTDLRTAPLALAIIGGGPAGLGVLSAAAGHGLLPELRRAGVALFESADIGSGGLGEYVIGSDSHAESFLTAIEEPTGSILADLADDPAVLRIAEHRGGPVPLTWAADVQRSLAGRLRTLLAEDPDRPEDLADAAADQPVLREGVRVTAAVRDRDGCWTLQVSDHTGRSLPSVRARTVVLATGAHQDQASLAGTVVAGVDVTTEFADRVMGSADLLRHGGVQRAREILSRRAALRRQAGAGAPRIVIVGASHSALSAAALLLDADDAHGELGLSAGSIKLLHRQPLRVTWASPEEAVAAGFRDFGPEDICPSTGRVFPLAGFRGRSRDLALRLTRLAGSPLEPRVRLLPMGELPDAATDSVGAAILDSADLIVLATGYRPRGLDLFGPDAERIRLLAETRRDAALVDVQSRVLDQDGAPVPGVYGLGLAAGYPLAGRHGEPSFTGQANGLALWQTTIGLGIVRDALAAARGPVVTVAPRQEWADVAAREIVTRLAAAVQARGHATFIPSAGRTPTEIYARLRDQHRSSLDWSRVTLVQMDDYAGMPPADPRSFAHHLRSDLAEPLGMPASWLNDDSGRLAASMEEVAARCAAVDLVVHGIGANGHIAFNEPGTSPEWVGGCVELTAGTLAANVPAGEDPTDYRVGWTLGLATLLRARSSIVIALGESKADAVAALLAGPVGRDCPASFLRRARDVSVILDADAAARLRPPRVVAEDGLEMRVMVGEDATAGSATGRSA